MKRNSGRCMALALALVMILSLFPVGALAEGDGSLPVRFICDETTANVTVYDAGGQPVDVGTDGVHHLTPGTYYYSAEAEGYESTGMQPFTVPADAVGDQELRLSLTPAAGGDQAADPQMPDPLKEADPNAPTEEEAEDDGKLRIYPADGSFHLTIDGQYTTAAAVPAELQELVAGKDKAGKQPAAAEQTPAPADGSAAIQGEVPGAIPGEVPAAAPLDAADGIPALNPAENPLGVPVENAANGTETGNTAVPPSAEPAENTAALKKGLYLKQPAAEELYLDRLTLEKALGFYVADWTIVNLVDEESERKEMTGSYNVTVSGPAMDKYRDYEPVFALMTLHWDEEGNIVDRDLSIIETTHTPTKSSWSFMTDKLSTLLIAVPTSMPYVDETEKEFKLTAQTLSTEDGRVTVSGMLPKGATLSVVEVPFETAAELYASSTGNDATAESVLFAYDISILYNGQKYQPEDFDEKVRVTINDTNTEDKINVLHVKTDLMNIEITPEETALPAEGEAVPEAAAETETPAEPATPESELLPAETVDGAIAFDMSSFSIVIGIHGTKLSANVQALSKIIIDDQMYTTLLDKDLKVVSTNDPEVEQDIKYKSKEDGGEGATIDRTGENSKLTVRFRMAAIAPHDGSNGVQEGVAYSLALPQSADANGNPVSTVLPAEVDANGTKIVNPDEAVEFFQLEGGLRAFGEITGADPDYTLYICFEDVEDWLDISGTFQYEGTVNEALEPGKTYNLDYVPGGTVSFTVTPEKPPEPDQRYKLSMTGSIPNYYTDDNTILWTVTVEDLSETPSMQALPLVINLDEGSAVMTYRSGSEYSLFGILAVDFTVTYSDGTVKKFSDGSLSANRLSGSGFAIYPTGTSYNPTVTADGSRGILGTLSTSSGDAFVNGHYSSGKYLSRTLYFDFGALRNSNSDGGNPNGTDNPDPIELDIVKYEISFRSVIYDDYKTFGKSYTGNATLVGGKITNEGTGDLYASGGTGRSFYSGNSPYMYLSGQGTGATDGYAYRTKEIKNQFNTNTQYNYYGDYFFIEYVPQRTPNTSDPENGNYTNSLNANYYIDNSSFYSSGNLTGNYATFSSFKVENSKWSQNYWNRIATMSSGNMTANTLAGMFGNNGDSTQQAMITAYQMEKVFSGKSGTYVIYRSSGMMSTNNPMESGRYIYLVIDPETYQTAYRNYGSNGWRWMSEAAESSSLMPAGFKIHVFGASGCNISGEFTQKLGALIQGNTNTGGSFYDSFYTGYLNSDYGSVTRTSTASSFGEGTYAATYMRGEWITDDTIFWRFTFDADYLSSFRSNYIWVNAPGQTLPSGSPLLYEGSTLYQGVMHYYNPYSKTWSPYSSLYSSYNYWTNIAQNSSNAYVPSGSGGNWYYGTFGDVSGYKDSNGEITLGFTTKVAGSSSEPLKCFAEFVGQMYDIAWSKSGGSVYPVKFYAESSVPAPTVVKTSAGAFNVNGNDENAMTAVDWKIKISGLSNVNRLPSTPNIGGVFSSEAGHYGYFGAFSGRLAITDSMAASTSDAGVNPAAYTHITQMNGSSIGGPVRNDGCGPIPYPDAARSDGYYGDTTWWKLVGGAWQQTGRGTLWESHAPGVYRRQLGMETWLMVFYSGNMAQSYTAAGGPTPPGEALPKECSTNPLVVYFTGLKQSVTIGDISYRTEFDNAAFAAAALNNPGQSTSVTLTNSAATSMQSAMGSTPSAVSIPLTVAAALAINKDAGKVAASDPANGVYNDAYTGTGYTVKSVLGYSPSEYLVIEDFIQGFKEKINGEQKYETTDSGACDAIANVLKISNLVIKWLDPTSTSTDPVTIFENGTAVDPWVVTPETPEKHGALFRYKITRSDGKKVAARSEFTVIYDMTLEMDKPYTDSAGNVIPGTDGKPMTFRGSADYHGGTLLINNNAMSIRTFESITPGPSGIAYTGKQLTVRPLVSYSKVEGPALMAYEIRTDGTLMVDGDAGANAEYLIEPPGPIKVPIVGDSNGHSEWLLYEWTGTAGKPPLVLVSLTDTLRLTFSEVTYTKDGATVQGSQNDLTELEYIAEKHATYSNIKVYETKQLPSASNPGTQLWAPVFSFSGADGSKSDSTTTSGGLNLSLRSFPATFSPATEDTDASHGHTGFTLRAESLPYSDFLSVTYDLDIDWDAFYEEAKVKFPELKFKVNRTNTVIDQNEKESSSSGSEIEIQDTAIVKEIKDSTPKDGKATWQVTASIGQKENGAFLTITDTVAVAIGTEEPLKTAVQTATSIDPASVKVILKTSQGQTTVWENGGPASVWTSENISVVAEGLNLSVLIQDAENSIVLGNNQSYIVTYDTVLDKDKFIQNGGKAGDSYALDNSADMSYGSSFRTAGTETEPTPDVPITAKKVANKNPADYIASWTAEAGTGEAARKEFTLRDQVGTQDNLAGDYLSISSFSVTVTDGDGISSSFNADSLPEGVTLTDADGNEFALNVPGNTGFKLVFAELPKGTTVTVNYQTTLDRDGYTEAGGAEGATVVLKNSFHAGSGDGYEAGAGAEAELINRDLLGKSGNTISALSANGNPMIEWTVPVNLNSQYSNEELAEMETVTVTDNLMSMLKYVNGSVRCKDLDTNANLTPTVETSGQTVKFTLNNPAEHPNFQLTFRTECLASVDALSNSVDLSLDGETITETETKVEEPIKAAGIYGTIRAVKAPEYTPTAWKYLEGQILTTADLYSFQITETDSNWNAIRGGYTETVKNNAEGQIPFSTIQYSGEGTHYYTIVELGADAEDQRVFKIQADVVHPGSEYYVEETVIEPQNYENVRFDNTKGSKTTSISVTKVWDDHNRSDSRPSHITVYLYQAGKPYNNMSATLNDSNGWSYTWEDLPIAGGEYSVVEKYVVGYVASYHVDGNTTTIVNYRGLPQTGQNWWPVILLSVSGTVVLAAGLILLMNSRRGKKRRV